MKIQQTRNYGMFVQDTVNRPITERDHNRLAKLRDSMKKYGFLPCFAIWVIRQPDGTHKIKDGQHRLIVAEELSLPVFYVDYDRDDVDISDCAAGQSSWSVYDFVASFAAQGKKDYQELLMFQMEHGLPLGACASILYGYGARSSAALGMLRKGHFTIRDRRGANRIVRILAALRKHADWVITGNSIGAISRFIHVKEFNDDQLINRADAHPALLRKQPTTETFSVMYDELYNHGMKHKIALAFMAKQEATKRGDVGEKNKARKAAVQQQLEMAS